MRLFFILFSFSPILSEAQVLDPNIETYVDRTIIDSKKNDGDQKASETRLHAEKLRHEIQLRRRKAKIGYNIPKTSEPEQNNASAVNPINFIINSPQAVSDPGEEGKKTLQGIDSDKDGVRDDVQRWILENYANKPSTQKAIVQMTKAYQDMLNYRQDKIKLKTEIAPAYSRSFACLSWVSNNIEKIVPLIESKVLNTESRVIARLKAESNLGGYSPPDDIARTRRQHRNKFCNFEASKE